MLQIGVVGINYKTAPLKLRESLARKVLESNEFEELIDTPFVLLSTCNRFEVYFSSPDLYTTSHKIVRQIERLLGGGSRSSFYHYFDHTCFFHLAKVISGLDAAIIGESDVKRQVKKAYLSAHQKRRLSKEIHFLFQKSMRISKYLRTHYLNPHHLMNLEEIIYTMSKKWLDRGVLFVGYSEINRKISKSLLQQGIHRQALCTRYNVDSPVFDVIPYSDIDCWTQYGVVIVGAKHPGYLLKAQHAYLRNVNTRALFDLGIPRNVEPLLSENKEINLYSIDMLADAIEERRAPSLFNIRSSEEVIREMTKKYEKSYNQRELEKARLLVGV